MSCRGTVDAEGDTGVSVGFASEVVTIAALIVAPISRGRRVAGVDGDTRVSVELASVVAAIAALTVAPISGVGATVASIAGAWVGNKAQDRAKSPAKERHLVNIARFISHSIETLPAHMREKLVGRRGGAQVLWLGQMPQRYSWAS